MIRGLVVVVMFAACGAVPAETPDSNGSGSGSGGGMFKLTVTRTGAGSGRVTADGIDCGTVCNHDYPEGTTVVLHADGDPGSAFVAWSGDGVACPSNGDCSITLTAATTVTAEFVLDDCMANTTSCNSGNTRVTVCDSAGHIASTETCQLPCVAGAGQTPAHCAYLAPIYLANVCDTPAPSAAAMLSVDTNYPLNTDTDAICNGGVVTTTTPNLCVFHYGTITFGPNSTTKVTGARVPVFVADQAFAASGIIDVSADGSTSGPGGGVLSSGGSADQTAGGGAGFKTAGGAGGGATAACGGGAGGAISDPVSPTLLALRGGARSPAPITPTYARGGGGGGALMLVSCKGTVTVTGTIDAGGGGGGGGPDANPADEGYDFRFGAGGGAGGYVVVQAANVSIPAVGRIFANGGGGGAGCPTDNTVGNAGQDALRTTAQAPGGTPSAGATNAGGMGGSRTAAPTCGGNTFGVSPAGGGGGAAGRIQLYAPTGVTISTASTEISPMLETNRVVPTR